jgi:hypothetical protein
VQDGVAATAHARPVPLAARMRGFADLRAWTAWLHALVPDTIKEFWALAMMAVLAWFAASLVESIAQVQWQELQARREDAAAKRS